MVNSKLCAVDQSHLLRNRYGKCVECNPASLAFQARRSSWGFVYLAGSKATGLMKIGLSIDPNARNDVLNDLKYGGASDWVFLAVAKADHAGLVEHTAQSALSGRQTEGWYMKDGRRQSCYELFKCSHQEALNAFKEAVAADNGEIVSERLVSGHFGAVS